MDAVRAVAAVQSLLDPALTEQLFENLRDADRGGDLIARLSGQERRILSRLAQGKTNREIADEMFLTEKTVKNYVSNLPAKMGMSRRSEAAAYVARVEECREPHYPPEEWAETCRGGRVSRPAREAPGFSVRTTCVLSGRSCRSW